MKKIIALFMTLTICVSITSTAFAADEGSAEPLSDVFRYHTISNKVFINTTIELDHYITDVWAKASEYTVEKGESFSVGLSVSATAGSFPLSTVSATGSFDTSYSRSYSVSTTIPVDSTKYSKLAYYAEYNNYTCDLYYVQAMAFSETRTKVGSGTVHEPVDLYIDVAYK